MITEYGARGEPEHLPDAGYRPAAPGTSRTTRTRSSTRSRSRTSERRSSRRSGRREDDRGDPAPRHARDHRYFYSYVAAGSSKVKSYMPEGLSRARAGEGLARHRATRGRLGRRRAAPAESEAASAIARYVLKRVGLAVVTLVLLSIIVFADRAAPARATSGGSSSGRSRRRAVNALDKQLGANQPAVVQYMDWVSGISCTGTSAPRSRSRCPSASCSGRHCGAPSSSPRSRSPSACRSACSAGSSPGLRTGSAADRGITVVGLSLAVVPEFVPASSCSSCSASGSTGCRSPRPGRTGAGVADADPRTCSCPRSA